MMKLIKKKQKQIDSADFIFCRIKSIAFLVHSQDPQIKARMMFPRYNKCNNKTIDLRQILMIPELLHWFLYLLEL